MDLTKSKDFIEILDLENDITSRPYKAEDALEIVNDSDELNWAKVNEAFGPGITYKKGDRIVSCAGIRTRGLGEIWGVFTNEAKGAKKELLKQSRIQIKNMMDSEKLWKVIATTENISKQQANFLEHLGFVKSECYIYIRKGT